MEAQRGAELVPAGPGWDTAGSGEVQALLPEALCPPGPLLLPQLGPHGSAPALEPPHSCLAPLSPASAQRNPNLHWAGNCSSLSCRPVTSVGTQLHHPSLSATPISVFPGSALLLPDGPKSWPPPQLWPPPHFPEAGRREANPHPVHSAGGTGLEPCGGAARDQQTGTRLHLTRGVWPS